MDTLLSVNSPQATQETVKALTDSIEVIFCAAAKTNMEQKTVRLAIKALFRGVTPGRTEISGCTLTGDKNITL